MYLCMYVFIYLFNYVAVLGLSCSTQDLRCSMRDLSLRHAGSSLWHVGFSLVVARRLSSCGMWGL